MSSLASASAGARSIAADDVVAALDEAYPRRGAPEFLRCDNSSELVAAIKDWCPTVGTGGAYIEAGSPWQNPSWRASTASQRRALHGRLCVAIAHGCVSALMYSYACSPRRSHGSASWSLWFISWPFRRNCY